MDLPIKFRGNSKITSTVAYDKAVRSRYSSTCVYEYDGDTFPYAYAYNKKITFLNFEARSLKKSSLKKKSGLGLFSSRHFFIKISVEMTGVSFEIANDDVIYKEEFQLSSSHHRRKVIGSSIIEPSTDSYFNSKGSKEILNGTPILRSREQLKQFDGGRNASQSK